MDCRFEAVPAIPGYKVAWTSERVWSRSPERLVLPIHDMNFSPWPSVMDVHMSCPKSQSASSKDLTSPWWSTVPKNPAICIWIPVVVADSIFVVAEIELVPVVMLKNIAIITTETAKYFFIAEYSEVTLS
jgi:hypothetical protein